MSHEVSADHQEEPPEGLRKRNPDRHLLFTGVTTLLLIVFFIGVGEVACRFLVSPRHKFHWVFPATERNTLYEFDEILGWRPKKNHQEAFQGAVRIQVDSNSDGFRDVEHDLSTKQRPRLMVLGDSFVWGYDVEAEDRFTDLLQERNPDIEVFNCGVSGYSTAQELLLFREFGKKYRPDIVLVVFSGNDRNGNIRPISGAGYSRPIFRKVDGKLVPSNLPLTRTTPFEKVGEEFSYRYRSHLWDALRYLAYKTRLRLSPDLTEELFGELSREVASLGGKLLIAIQSSDTELEEYTKREGIPSVMVDEYLESVRDPDQPIKFSSHGRHWTPYGHRLVADLLEPFLEEQMQTDSP